MRKPANLRRSILVALAKGLLVFSLIATTFNLTGEGFEMAPSETDDITAIRPGAGPASLIAKHDCWTGEAPADMTGVVPGHVVVTQDDKVVYGGSRLVGKSLEQVFEGANHNLTIHGFCR